LSHASRIARVLGKASGIRWYAVVDLENNAVIDRSPRLGESSVSDVLAMAKLAGELASRSSKYSSAPTTTAEPVHASIRVKLDGEVVEARRFGESVVIAGFDSRLTSILEALFDRVERGDSIKCEVCGAELLTETIECPRCGRTVPFIAVLCPFCEYDLSYRKCPSHRGLITAAGRQVKRDYSVIAASAALAAALLGFTFYMAPLLTGLETAVYALGAVIAGLVLAVGYLFSKPRGVA